MKKKLKKNSKFRSCKSNILSNSYAAGNAFLYQFFITLYKSVTTVTIKFGMKLFDFLSFLEAEQARLTFFQIAFYYRLVRGYRYDNQHS